MTLPPPLGFRFRLALLTMGLVASARALPLVGPRPWGFDTSNLDLRLLAFGLYGSNSLKLNDGVRIQPWRMGTGGELRMGVGTVVSAYTFATGNVSWGRSSTIQGDLRLGGSFTTQAGAWVHGAVVPDPNLTPLKLRFDPVFLAPDSSRVGEAGDSVVYTASGYPRDLAVRAGGKVVLKAGAYAFRSLVLSPSAKVYVQGNGSTPFQADIHGEFLVDGAVILGLRYGSTVPDGRSMLWRYSGQSELHLNGTTRFQGTLVAPNAKVSIASYAGFQGCLWAKDVEIHQYNDRVQFVPYVADSRTADKDVDDLDDTLEFRLGTDPLNADTDGDGYSDGLEVRGRQGWMGAIKGISGASPHFWHSWGWALDTTRRDLFNPLRRDQFLRLVWESRAAVLALATRQVQRLDPAGACTTVPAFAAGGGWAAKRYQSNDGFTTKRWSNARA